MGRGIVRLAPDEYIEWSTVVDAPVSYVMTTEEALREFGLARVLRADLDGTSYRSPRLTLADLLDSNRAGPDESMATLDEIREKYRASRP